MKKLLTEEKVLKKLDIPDFRHLTKDKVITMASMLNKMDPEVAKKALEQFPNFANTAKEMLVEYKDILDKSLESNRESVQSYYQACHAELQVLGNLLEDENLTFDERKYFVDTMLEITKTMGLKDSENKKFLTNMAMIGGFVVVGLAAVLAITLGANAQIEGDDSFNDFE